MIKLLLFVAWWTCSIGFILRSCRFFRQNKELLSRYEVQSTNTDDDPSMFTGPLFEGDVVEYIIEDSDRSRKGPMLGAISVSGPSSSVIKINQLCLREDYLSDAALDERREVCLYEHMGKESILYPDRGGKVRIVGQWSEAQYTQRTVEDRVSNPHGEHAENVWLVPSHLFRSLLAARSLVIDIDSEH